MVSGTRMRSRLYTRREELAEGEMPVPLKLLHINRCPVVAPLSVLRETDRQRLQLDWTICERNAEMLKNAQALWQDKLPAVYREESFEGSSDPEQQLYDGFIGDRDRRLCEQVRSAQPQALANDKWPFDDARLPELLFRYRARNFPDSLSPVERQRWMEFCRQRLSDPQFGAPNTLGQFRAALQQLRADCSAPQLQLLQQWQAYADELQARFAVI